MFTQDYVLNGQGHGPLGQMVGNMRFDPGMHRPYFQTRQGHRNYGQRCVTMNTGRTKYDSKANGGKGAEVPIMQEYTLQQVWNMGIPLPPTVNATSLRKEEWIELDRQVLRGARYRLRAWADLSRANSFGGFNGMSKLLLEHETMSDPGEAIVDMNGITEGRRDAPQFQLQGLPLPITHSDFSFDARRLAVSRNSGTPIDTTMGEASGRRVAEAIEKTCIGNQTGVIYGGNSTQTGGYGRTSQVYGYLTFPSRLTKSNGYIPSGNGRAGTGWTPLDTLLDVLAALDQLRAQKFYGPFMIYHSNDWDQYLDRDYILTGGNVATQTLRQRLLSIGQGDGYSGEKVIEGVRRLDFLFSSAPSTNQAPAGSFLGQTTYTGPGGENVAANYAFTFIIVQMTPDVARAVNGMDITTLQWETKGGMELNFKVMAIQVPQIRADFYGNCGIEQITFAS